MRTRVTMLRVAWWTYALLSLAGARVYERCELAYELRQLGIDRKHISTWVCIAFHESRFDTAAQNFHSGDHGILQISELYWCGAGKACGLPCSALRDDDISDDVECAVRIYEEHTRIQGDGFLAWVVYPQHCKQNTKKYLVDCDGAKNVTRKTSDRQHIFSNNTGSNVEMNATTRARTVNDFNIDELKPPYLSIGSVIQRSYGNELEQIDYYRKYGPRNWLNYKIDNIDNLKIPLSKEGKTVTPPTTTKTSITTTKTTTRPTIRYQLETNQFRRKFIPSDNQKLTTKWNNNLSYITTTTRPTTRSYATTTFRPLTTKSPTTYRLPMTKQTTVRITTTEKPRRKKFTTTAKGYMQTTAKPQPSFTFTTRPSTVYPIATKQSTQRPTAVRTLVTRSWTNDRPRISTPSSVVRAAKTTQSIFDLYLNSRRPTLATFKFSSVYDDRYKLKIFSGGTTTPVPSYKTSARSPKYPTGGAAKNQVKRRQISEAH